LPYYFSFNQQKLFCATLSNTTHQWFLRNHTCRHVSRKSHQDFTK